MIIRQLGKKTKRLS